MDFFRFMSSLCRAGGLSQDVMSAGSKLQLDREPLTALAFSIMLLAFARDRAEQAALRQDSSLAVLTLLLQVGSPGHDCSQPWVCAGHLAPDLLSHADSLGDAMSRTHPASFKALQRGFRLFSAMLLSRPGCGLQSEQDTSVKAGDSCTLQARSTLSRLLKDSPILTALPIAHRLSPATLVLVALAGKSHRTPIP